MKKYLMFNDLVRFNLYLENDLFISKLKKYLGDYILFRSDYQTEKEEINDIDLSIIIIEKEAQAENWKFQRRAINGFNCALKDEKFYIILGQNNLNDNILFLKRILSDLVNRFIEIKGGMFFHSSSIVALEKSVIFIGDKGTGKTTNMLYILKNGEFDYCSNERTGLIKIDDSIITYGSPARINIRVNTLEQNEKLRKLLWDKININDYKKYKNLSLSRECSERVVVSFEDICNSLNISSVPFSNLGAICNLIFDPIIDFKIEKITYDEIKPYLLSSKINGVFEQREELNDIFECENNSLDNILRNINNVTYYNIRQNNSKDNSAEIMEIIMEDMVVDKCLMKS